MQVEGVFLPGQRQVEYRTVDLPEPGWGQVLVEMKASSICGSDIRAIYREHLGQGPEAYQDVIAGHEPCGQIVRVGPGCKRFHEGDRVVLYHISGCGVCHDCREGYMISCTSPERAAYGWQRHGGHAPYLLAEENTCVALPDDLTYVDGALVACGFGTVYEALQRVRLSGNDRALVVGLGPVGLAAAMVARQMGASSIIGVDVVEPRMQLATDLGLFDRVIHSDDSAEIMTATSGSGCEVSIDCSGATAGRAVALGGTARWGRLALVGEGNQMAFDASHDVIHRQITVFGSWVTSLGHMEDLVARLVEWQVHPEAIVTHRFSLDQAADAYRVADEGYSGKVTVVME